MKKLLVVLFLTTFVFAQQTQPNKADKKEVKKSRVPIEFYYNGKNKRTAEVVKQLTSGMRYADKTELILKDVSLNADHAAWVNVQVAKLPLDQQRYIDIVVVVGELLPADAKEYFDINTLLFGATHVANFLNQAILFKLGKGVEKPPYYTRIEPPKNPLDAVNKKLDDIINQIRLNNDTDLKLNIIIALLALIIISGGKKVPVGLFMAAINAWKNRKEFKQQIKAFKANKDTNNPKSYNDTEKTLREMKDEKDS